MRMPRKMGRLFDHAESVCLQPQQVQEEQLALITGPCLDDCDMACAAQMEQGMHAA